MTKEELLKELRLLVPLRDPDADHKEADDLLILYINDLDITAAFDSITKWYS